MQLLIRIWLLKLVIFAIALGGSGQQITTPSLSLSSQQITTQTIMATTFEEKATSPSLDFKPDEEAMKFLRQLEEKYKKVETITGEFKQFKRSTIFLEEIESEGKFYFKKPGKFRCDYLPPNESVNIVVDDVAWLYVPEIKQVEKYYFEKSGSKAARLNQMLLGFGISVEDVLEVYGVKLVEKVPEKSEIAIKFTLLEGGREEINFESLTIWFNLRTMLVKKIYIDEINDDETIIDVKKIDLNKPISETMFRTYFPPDVEIIERY